MQDYSTFARFYDQVMGDRADSTELIRRPIRHFAPEAKSLLELGCGTGSVLKLLAQDYEIYGLERSSDMLAVARQKVPPAKLLQGDISRFELGRRFDVVICVFDTINHLPQWEQWRGLFSAAAAHLVPGGLFVFDMNTTGRLGRLSREETWVHHFGSNYMLMKVTAAGHGYDWDIKFFEREPDGRFKLHQENITEVSFPIEKIKEALTIDFELLDNFSLGTGRGDEADRVYFVCRRK